MCHIRLTVSTRSPEHSLSRGGGRGGGSTGTPAAAEEGEPKTAPSAAGGNLNIQVNTDASDRHREAGGRVCAATTDTGVHVMKARREAGITSTRGSAHTRGQCVRKSLRHTHNRRGPGPGTRQPAFIIHPQPRTNSTTLKGSWKPLSHTSAECSEKVPWQSCAWHFFEVA